MKAATIEKLTAVYAWTCGILLVGIVGGILGYLFYRGWPGMNLSLIFGDTSPVAAILLRQPVFNGLFPAIFGTLVLVLLSVSIAVPLGIAAGIYLAEYAGQKARHIFGMIFDILAGIPSIVIGLFGFSVAVFLHHHFSDRIQPCLLISALSLAFLVLPYLIRTTQVAIEDIPRHTRITGTALGASPLQNIIHVLIPHSLGGILSGVVLAVGRCAEDTAVIMLTGVVASAGVPRSLMGGYEALPFYIYYISAQYTNEAELTSGFSACIILILLCASLFGMAFWIRRRISARLLYRH
ncbi:MAG: ABC transporter permease subunit [Thermodesulfobacteriota bacterium]|nr:ABC transporter permease subunit [Thermodesulfobacteriota bacterium]